MRYAEEAWIVLYRLASAQYAVNKLQQALEPSIPPDRILGCSQPSYPALSPLIIHPSRAQKLPIQTLYPIPRKIALPSSTSSGL